MLASLFLAFLGLVLLAFSSLMIVGIIGVIDFTLKFLLKDKSGRRLLRFLESSWKILVGDRVSRRERLWHRRHLENLDRLDRESSKS